VCKTLNSALQAGDLSFISYPIHPIFLILSNGKGIMGFEVAAQDMAVNGLEARLLLNVKKHAVGKGDVFSGEFSGE
jgi:hypothetical protein